ncbi:MAG: DUF2167 domain-containing protein [Sphingomonadaceae bacterium]|nr:DUF2167 domain-containing protein [Sphingomonadaceae bacterium]
MRFIKLIALAILAYALPLAAKEDAAPPLPPEAQEYLKTLNPVSGTVEIPEAKASLDLGSDYVFYGKVDASRILTEIWGNPPEAVSDVLGLVMKAGTSPFSESWGAVVTFEDVGYVSDDDAAEVDYDELLEQLQEGTIEANEVRKEMGYPTVTLVGWAARPVYDDQHHSVVWAKNLKFAGDVENSLNYDVRTLGRYGVLSVNVVSTMSELEEITTAAHELASHASFAEGARYQDFDASTDRTAEYGIGGLIAAGAGVAAAKKLGLFAILLKFIKPILLGFLVFFGVFWRKLKGVFGFGKDDSYDAEWEEYSHDDTPPDDLTGYAAPDDAEGQSVSSAETDSRES